MLIKKVDHETDTTIDKHVRPSTSYLSHVVLLFHNMPSTWRIFNPRFRLFCRQSLAERPCLDFPSIFSSSRRGSSLFFSLIRERSLRPLIHSYLSFLLLLSLSSILPIPTPPLLFVLHPLLYPLGSPLLLFSRVHTFFPVLCLKTYLPS